MIEIFPLSEGAFTIDGSKEFVPFEKGNDELNDRPTGSLLVEVQPFLVKHKDSLILLDTGLGKKLPDGSLQIHTNLRNAGFQPEAVTHVILSHLHKDHAGGLGNDSINMQKQMNFPDAKHYVHKKEWEYANEKGLPSYDPDDFSFMRQNGNLVFMEGEKGLIGETGIEFEIVGGHCPFHLALWIKENDQIVFYGGDVAPQLGQMRRRVNAKYDHDGKRSMELRQQWWETGQQEHWTFLFYHDIKTPVKVA